MSHRHTLKQVALGPGDAITAAEGAAMSTLNLTTEPPPVPQLDSLLERTGQGDRGAFAELYNHISSRVFGHVRGVLRDPAQSEEVTQEVFLEIWQTATRFDTGKGKALSWTLTMAHRRAVDRVRSSQAARARDERVGRRDLDIDHDATAETAEIWFEHRKVVEAMKQISPLQREAIDLCYHDGYSAAEAAVILNVAVGTVKTRVRDGLLRLRQVLA